MASNACEDGGVSAANANDTLGLVRTDAIPGSEDEE